MSAKNPRPGERAMAERRPSSIHTRANGWNQSGSNHKVVLALALVLMVFAVYGSHIATGGFIWDDDDYIYQNPHLPAADGLWRIWTTDESPQYYPLVFSTLWLEHQLWGNDPRGYHFVNVALHGLNAVLVWLVLRRMRPPGFFGAYAVAAIFALHPMHVETVAWAAEHKNTMSTMFYLLALLCYWRFDELRDARQVSSTPPPPTNRAHEPAKTVRGPLVETAEFWYVLMLVCFILGSFCKTVIATLPIAILLLRYWRGLPIRLMDGVLLLPMLVLGMFMGLVTGTYEHYRVIGELGVALSPEWHMTLTERMVNAGRVLWFYAGKIVWPHPLNFNYPRWEIDATSLVQWLGPLSAFALAAVLFAMQKRWGRGLFVAACFYAISVAPALGFVNIAPLRYSFVADHFCYLPSLGVITAVVGVAGWIIRRAQISEDNAHAAIRSGGIATAIVVALFAWMSFDRTRDYRTVEALWRDTLDKNKRSWLARVNLGRVLRDRGDHEEAIAQFTQMMNDWPDWWEPVAGGHNGIGTVRMVQGDYESAREHFAQAVERHKHPVEARFNLGVALFELKRDEEAIEQFQETIEMNPLHGKAQVRLAMALERRGDFENAERFYLEAQRLVPGAALTHAGLGAIAQRKGDLDQALVQYREAVRLDPFAAQTRLRLAEAQRQAGLLNEAIMTLRDGIALHSSAGAPSRSELGKLYFQLCSLYRTLRQDAELVGAIRQAMKSEAADSQLMLVLADTLVTSPIERVRNPAEASEIMKRIMPAVSDVDRPFGLHVLATTQAGQGDFEGAVKTAQEALQLAQSRRLEQLVRDIRLRLESYQAGKAYQRTQ